ncbi:hypothetical protein OS493_036719 [Desmophyllum pertusum]|uniref:Uncharacterized protein n=1 Tax=Desmophyllum pertusum TaxID=174260 RepID=A0A9W9Z737_9CNID|nr:hypothetical protein OS493_036719 [Desmophyllum pertusum]
MLQKNNMLQKANGLNLKFGGASYNSLDGWTSHGFILFTQILWRNYQKELADKNKQDIGKIIKTAIQEKSFIMLVEDDIHFIHASRQPTSSKTSTAWHMCTGIMDVQQSVSALPRPPTVQDLHRIVPLLKNGAVKQCRGGIDVKDILNKFSMSISQFF